jgi:hypothetical protein
MGHKVNIVSPTLLLMTTAHVYLERIYIAIHSPTARYCAHNGRHARHCRRHVQCVAPALSLISGRCHLLEMFLFFYKKKC